MNSLWKTLIKPQSPRIFFTKTIFFADPAAGGSDDWFKGGNDAKYAYTMELPGGGSGGFDPPPSMIKPVVTSVFEGIKVGGNLVASLGKKTK